MIKIATAECFTHGKIGRELHAIAQGYTGNFGRDYIENPESYGNFNYNELSVTCSLFIPTIEAVKSVLQIENKGAYPFIILSVCNVPVNWTIAPGAKESLLFPEAAQPKHIKRKDHARSVELLHGDSLEYLLTTKTGEFVDGFSLFQDGSTGKWTVSAL